MAMFSLNNGHTYYSMDDIINDEQLQQDVIRNWEALALLMEDDIREVVHNSLAPCTELEFLAEYLQRANDNLIMG